MHRVLLGTLFANLDMAEITDRETKIEIFLKRHPDILDWCQNNISNWNTDWLLLTQTVWGRFHAEYTFELCNLPEAEAVAARLRFA
jgi:hypothetical protein